MACSGADPVIYKIESQLQVYWQYPAENFQERLLVQVLADDDDGFDEIYEIYIIHDESEYYWRATKNEWDLVEEEGNQWIILNNIISAQFQNLPRGEYRVVLIDFSGYRDEQSIFVTQKNRIHKKQYFPVFSLQSEGLYVPFLQTGENKELQTPIILELGYPDLKKDVAGNVKNDEYINEVHVLGKNGELYEVDEGKPVQFVLNKKSRVVVYLHNEGIDGILYTSGPYELNFTSF